MPIITPQPEMLAQILGAFLHRLKSEDLELLAASVRAEEYAGLHLGNRSQVAAMSETDHAALAAVCSIAQHDRDLIEKVIHRAARR